jgi:protein TonB
MAASKAPANADRKRRRIIGVLLGIVIISGIVSLMMRTGNNKTEKEEFVIVDLTPPPPPPPPPPPEEEKPPEPEEEMEPTEITEADTPDDISEDQGEQIDLGIDAGDLSSGPGTGGFLINIGRGGRGSGGGGGGGGLLDDVDAPPTPISKIQPSYPSGLLKSGVGGRVLISCVVDETGKVVSATVKQSAHPDLDKAAIAAVNKWKFKPANRDGRSVTAKCVVPFNFEVKKS